MFPPVEQSDGGIPTTTRQVDYFSERSFTSHGRYRLSCSLKFHSVKATPRLRHRRAFALGCRTTEGRTAWSFDISLDNDTAMNSLSGGDGDENIQLTRRGFCRQH